jgi:Enoyl-(Acyl carrier protein) reductase
MRAVQIVLRQAEHELREIELCGPGRGGARHSAPFDASASKPSWGTPPELHEVVAPCAGRRSALPLRGRQGGGDRCQRGCGKSNRSPMLRGAALSRLRSMPSCVFPATSGGDARHPPRRHVLRHARGRAFLDGPAWPRRDHHRANAAAPGFIQRPTAPIHGDILGEARRLRVLARRATSDEIAGTVAFLASDDAGFFVGNGGIVAI